jgi:hypothetical protein
MSFGLEFKKLVLTVLAKSMNVKSLFLIQPLPKAAGRWQNLA